MKVKVIPSEWIYTEKIRRMDCTPYILGSIENRNYLQKSKLKKDPLNTLTSGHDGGIFNGPHFRRNYVKSLDFGVPFLTSSSMLEDDLSTAPLLSKKDAFSKKLGFLKLIQGSTLISCSGTIGKTIFSRQDMDGLWSSQDVLKIVPNIQKIPPGYLFAFLKGSFGIPFVISGTYGAIIRHLEPEHLHNIPIPRLSEDEEEKVHNLVAKAAELRTESSKIISTARGEINRLFNFPERLAESHRIFSVTTVSSKNIQYRFDAKFNDIILQTSERLLDKIIRKKSLSELGILGLESGRMKQVFVESQHGIPFLTSREIFRIDIIAERFLSKQLTKASDVGLVEKEDILIARSGQVGGIIGRGVWADKRFTDIAVSPHVLRLRNAEQSIDSGYLFAYLCLSDVGYRQCVRFAYGSSVPAINPDQILSIKIPLVDEADQKSIGQLIRSAGDKKTIAQEYEQTAIRMVEQAIKEAA
ncbi:MAG: restriction endonuclease subunit S [Flavobacteriales bacterium]|nr:restriction endonuclease subunit S [Flavobacteriales bacterium]